MLASTSAATATCWQTCGLQQQQQDTQSGGMVAHTTRGTTTATAGRRGSLRARGVAGRASMGTFSRAGTGALVGVFLFHVLCVMSVAGVDENSCLHVWLALPPSLLTPLHAFPPFLAPPSCPSLPPYPPSCSGLLVRHARRVLGVAAEVLNQPGRPRVMRACKEVRQALTAFVKGGLNEAFVLRGRGCLLCWLRLEQGSLSLWLRPHVFHQPLFCDLASSRPLTLFGSSFVLLSRSSLFSYTICTQYIMYVC